MSFKYLAAALAASVTVLAADLQLDIAVVAAAGAPPTPSIAQDAPSQTIHYDAAAIQQQAAAEQKADPATPATKFKRAACDPLWAGKGPIPNPDTSEAFLDFADLSNAALAAPTPAGYTNTFKNLKAMNNALGYMGYDLLDKYDAVECSKKCDVRDGCAAFNIAFERHPSIDPSPKGGACDNPPSTTLIKCVYWGGPVTARNAVNDGQWRTDFRVVIAGSNGYVNQTVDTVQGYTGPNFLGSRAISAPSDCNDKSTFVGFQYWNDGKPFDARRCGAACTAQTNANPSAPCRFFNTYVISKNRQPQGQYCAMYKQTWEDSHATLSKTAYQGSEYDISYSYSFTNTANNGLPCIKQAQITGCSNPGTCGSYRQCNPSQNCYCGYDVTQTQTACFQDASCSSQTCSRNSDCKTGQICLDARSCCGYSICINNSVCANGLSARMIFRKRQQDEDVLTAVHIPGEPKGEEQV
ncbi:hypothetical protein CB0940_11561 [Cercospora beticola]|uniref:Uncharacterized protein n=1 Tax=Cercospora beticola TaxID=122368 RepID=A0A2G5HDL6_CERBT|nr:hypothetical protein CB0940_11561 [Cercospora beticola]PIA90637.1 hypothetical protein CB0940_11561 [Cercospora beticola]WPB08433.1 hypothetical protein RHO25_013099 [Cercospora beticola]CAK1367665.1 unnamed protein product [Cercospora beticola]